MNTVFIGEFELNILWAILKLKKKALLVPITKQLSKTTGKKEPIEAVYTTLRQMEKVGFIRFGIWKAKKKRVADLKSFFWRKKPIIRQ